MNTFSYWNIPVGFDHLEDLERLLDTGHTLRFASPSPPDRTRCYVIVSKREERYRVEVRPDKSSGSWYSCYYQTLADLWRAEPFDLTRFQVAPPPRTKRGQDE